jgi:hypothetical protein
VSLERLMPSCLALLLVASFTSLAAAAAEHDLGESPENTKLRNRTSAPASSQIDSSVTLDRMLGAGESDLSAKKGASVTGYIVQVEKEEDGDVHLILASAKGETSTTKWVIVEVTPSWQKKKSSLSSTHLKKIVGHHVRVTGWLYHEPDPESEDPRGTRWEIHPVTTVVDLDAAKK